MGHLPHFWACLFFGWSAFLGSSLFLVLSPFLGFCQTPVLGLGVGVDFTFAFAWSNHKNDKNHNNPHLNFVKGTVLGDKEQGVWIRDKG